LKRDYGKEILIVGCGNSRMNEILYNEGYRNITNIDYSKVLIDEMNQKYAEKEEMECFLLY
jgi:2-polyprenyl-3-methyl-5-hydroxy-6-metoxy-1,4-benzoquinol methylase